MWECGGFRNPRRLGPGGRTWPEEAVKANLEANLPEEPTKSKCPLNDLPGSGADFLRFLSEQGGWPDLSDSLPPDKTLPIVLVSVDSDPKHFQASTLGTVLGNLFCRLGELQLNNRTVVLTQSHHVWSSYCDTWGADGARGPCSELRFISNAKFTELVEKLMHRTGFGSYAMIGKLLLASYLVEKGYSVLASDADTVWLRDPMPYFINTEEDLLGAAEPTCTVMNAGFVFYRSTEATRDMLRTALGILPTDKRVGLDQYLLNCAFWYHVTSHTLRYALLDDRFRFGGFMWNDQPYEAEGWVDTAAAPLDDYPNVSLFGKATKQLPLYVWHTSGFTRYGPDNYHIMAQRQVAFLVQLFGNVLPAQGALACGAGLSGTALRAAEARLYRVGNGTYNPTGKAADPWIHACPATCSDILGTVHALALTTAPFVPLDKSARDVAELDACLSDQWGTLDANGTCTSSAEELLEACREAPMEKLAMATLRDLCSADAGEG